MKFIVFMLVVAAAQMASAAEDAAEARKSLAGIWAGGVEDGATGHKLTITAETISGKRDEKQFLGEGTGQNGVFVRHETLVHLLDDGADGFGAQVFNPLLGPGDPVYLALGALRLAGQRQQQFADFLIAQLLEPESVFHIDDPITDVVGGFDQVSERMAAPGARRDRLQPQLPSDFGEEIQIVLVETEFLESDAGWRRDR